MRGLEEASARGNQQFFKRRKGDIRAAVWCATVFHFMIPTPFRNATFHSVIDPESHYTADFTGIRYCSQSQKRSMVVLFSKKAISHTSKRPVSAAHKNGSIYGLAQQPSAPLLSVLCNHRCTLGRQQQQ
jgi:hypothetical protein